MKNKNNRKVLVLGILVLFLGASILPSTLASIEEKQDSTNITTALMGITSRGNTLYVGGSGAGNYSSIQDAIDNASDGDTVFVYNGTYNENVNINKAINLVGEDKDTTTIYGYDELDHVVQITANLSNVSEFTIENGGINSAGIKVQADQCVIHDNIFTDNLEEGVWLDNSENNKIFNNDLSENSNGIYLYQSDDNMVSHNNVFDNRDNGVYCVKSDNNQILGNSVNSNDLNGIYLIQDCDYNIISNNAVTSNEKSSISIYASDGNRISNNTLLNNEKYGVRCKSSDDNIIYNNNFIGNDQNAYDDSTNTWHNSTLEQGNYWNDYTGEDNDKDGIGDTPYDIPAGDNQDEYPLMTLYGPPHAEYTYSVDEKNVSLNASLSYDYDGVITYYIWDFGDGNNGTGLLTNHTYAECGVYNVTLTVIDDDNKNDSTTKSIIVDNIPPELIDNTATVAYTGDEFTFNATVTDNVEVSEVLTVYRYEGEPIKNIYMNNTAGDYWEATIIIKHELTLLFYQIIAWDVSDNQNHTELKNVSILDNDLPEITDVAADPSIQMIGEYVNISAVVTDNIDVAEVYLYILYPDSTVQNFSITQNRTDDTYYSKRIYNQEGVHTFHIWAEDTSGNGNASEDKTFEMVTGSPPDAPDIQGEKKGKAGTSYPYTFSSTDPDGHDVFYYIDWDDNTTEEWIGPYESGKVITVNHTWDEKGDYTIRAKAKDTKGLESDWGTLDVTMPKSHYSFYSQVFQFLQKLVQRFPLLEKVFSVIPIFNKMLNLQ